ncbi:MAG: adenylyl-sulfate reductase subunit beta [archaeon]|nr:adenylyl-sulfate reductase subunit beta [archaeon]
MPTFVYSSKCDGCGKCVDICPSDIMHLTNSIFNGRKAYNIEPSYCWECYSCVKECPQHAIDMRGYADFAPLDHKLTVLRDKEKNEIHWKIKYRNDSKLEFTFPIRTKGWNSIKPPQSYAEPRADDIRSELLAHEPEYLKTDRGLLAITSQKKSEVK